MTNLPTTADVYSPDTAIGSTDWNGRVAPVGGTHTGTSILVMIDGLMFKVAHSRAEAEVKIAPTSMPPVPLGGKAWVAFDLPDSAVPIVLDASRVQSVQNVEPTTNRGTWSPDLLWGNFLWGDGLS